MLLDRLPCARIILVLVRNQGLQIVGLRIFRQNLLHCLELLARFLGLAGLQQHRHDHVMCGHLVGLDLERTAIRGKRGLDLLLREQQLALELPAFGERR
jgi:hypothetical protein